MVEPARLDLRGRERRRRQGCELGIRNRRCERALPPRHAPRGLPVGGRITIDGYLARNGTPTATSGKATFADGRSITIGAGAVAGEQK
jgi:hypothetical protein